MSRSRSRQKRNGRVKKSRKKRRRSSSSSSDGSDRSSKSSGSAGSSSSSTSGFTTPPQAFHRTKRIDPSASNRFPQIRVRKTRWEPMPEEVARPKSKNKKKTKSKKELIHNFQKEKDNFKPLLDFVDDRKQLAAELLDSMDVKSRNKILPELKDKNIFESRMIVYHFLKGMTRKRITAVMQGKDLSGSSSTPSDTDDNDAFDAMSLPPSTSRAAPDLKLTRKKQKAEKTNNKRMKERINEESFKRGRKMKKRMMEDDRELEEGEVRSSQEEEEEKEENGMEEKEESCSENSISSAECSENIGSNHSDHRRENGNASPIESKQQQQQQTTRETATNKRRKRQIAADEPSNAGPKFIISLNFSLPSNPDDDDLDSIAKKDADDFEQRVVCILPTSPGQMASAEQEANSDDEDDSQELASTSSSSESDVLLVNADEEEEMEDEQNPEDELDEKQKTKDEDDKKPDDDVVGKEEMELPKNGGVDDKISEGMEEGELGQDEDGSEAIFSDDGERTTTATTHSVVPIGDRVSSAEDDEEIEEPDIELVVD